MRGERSRRPFRVVDAAPRSNGEVQQAQRAIDKQKLSKAKSVGNQVVKCASEIACASESEADGVFRPIDGTRHRHKPLQQAVGDLIVNWLSNNKGPVESKTRTEPFRGHNRDRISDGLIITNSMLKSSYPLFFFIFNHLFFSHSSGDAILFIVNNYEGINSICCYLCFVH